MFKFEWFSRIFHAYKCELELKHGKIPFTLGKGNIFYSKLYNYHQILLNSVFLVFLQTFFAWWKRCIKSCIGWEIHIICCINTNVVFDFCSFARDNNGSVTASGEWLRACLWMHTSHPASHSPQVCWPTSKPCANTPKPISHLPLSLSLTLSSLNKSTALMLSTWPTPTLERISVVVLLVVVVALST